MFLSIRGWNTSRCNGSWWYSKKKKRKKVEIKHLNVFLWPNKTISF